ncbi:MAG: TolC family outer membrane protein [Rhodocyclaceae bacterium]|jgi:adhesin transport system outer membrane protein|nr:TolC family outer membrane protein [Rhodocyclaceae bacterium]
MNRLRIALLAALASVAAGSSTSALAQPAASTAPAATVREAAQKAVLTNPEVQARWHLFLSAAQEQEVARGGYLPRVDLSAGVGREHQHDPGLGDRDYTRRGATLSLSQMVYDGFATASEVSRLGHAKLTRYYELMDASEGAALEAARAYGDVLRYRELVKLAQDNYVQHKQVFDQIAERVKAGVGRRVDLEQASGRLALAESNLLTEASNLHDVSARYQRIVGEVPAAALPPLELGREGIPPAVAEALRQAYTGSPAYAAAAENVRAAQAELEGRRSRFQPRVDLRARQDVGQNIDGVDGHSNTRVVELVLNYNLFNGNADKAALGQYAERLNAARDQRDKSCRDIRQTLSIAHNDVQRLEEQLRYLDQHQLAIAKARDAYRKQFDIGQRTLLDLLDTENEYFQARRAYISAVFDQTIAKVRTLAGMGRLLPTLKVSRGDLPSLASLGQAPEEVDAATACPAEAPGMIQIDKEAILAEALKNAPPRQ